jgi:hypothetical protein
MESGQYLLAPATFTGSIRTSRNSKNPDYLAWTGSPQTDMLRPISTAFEARKPPDWLTENMNCAPFPVCGGPAAGMEGSSYYIPIRIDRDAPRIVAFEPSDGVGTTSVMKYL